MTGPFHIQQISKFKDNPTILQVLPELNSGGVERTTLEVASAITKAGGRSLVASAGGSMVDELERRGGHHIPFPLATRNPIKLAANIRHLRHMFLAEGVDIVHVRSRAPAWSVYKALKGMNLPLVTTFHAPYNTNIIFKRFYNSVMARGDRVIAISQFVLDHIRKEYDGQPWFSPQRLRLIHEGINLKFFDPKNVTDERINHLREKWSLEPDSKVIMLPGRLTRWKGQGVLLEALSLIKSGNVNIIMVGSDQGRVDYRQELMDIAEKLDLHGRLRLVDHCKDMPAAFMLADLIVSTSTDPEGFGLVMAEAQAMGKPVIASSHGAAMEVVVPNETGWHVPPRDPQALADKIDEFYALSPNQIEKMSKLARNHVEEDFSKITMCRKTLGVYNEFL